MVRKLTKKTWKMAIKLENKKKIRKSLDRTWNMVKNTEKLENEKHTLQDLQYGKKSDQKGK